MEDSDMSSAEIPGRGKRFSRKAAVGWSLSLFLLGSEDAAAVPLKIRLNSSLGPAARGEALQP
jgi:hypothetical protein